MNKQFIYWVLTLLLGFILQVILSKFIALSGILPNFLLLGTIFFAIRAGSIVGEWTGFLWGFLADVTSLSVFGSQIFMFTLIGFIAGKLHGKLDEDKIVSQMVLAFIISIFHVLGLLFFETLFGGAIQRFKVNITLFQPVYTAAVYPIVYWILSKWYVRFLRPKPRMSFL